MALSHLLSSGCEPLLGYTWLAGWRRLSPREGRTTPMRQWYAPKIVAQILQQRETYDRPTLPVYGPQHVRADSGLALPRERHRQLARTLPRPSTEAAFLPGVASMPCYPSSSCAPQGVARSQTVRQGVFANMSRWFARQVPRHVFAGGLMKVQANCRHATQDAADLGRTKKPADITMRLPDVAAPRCRQWFIVSMRRQDHGAARDATARHAIRTRLTLVQIYLYIMI